jgi:hypothetical protein
MHLVTEPLLWIVAAIFTAGGILATLRLAVAQMRKDINALGATVRRDRWNNMLADMVTTESREDRQRLADLMRQQ